MRVMMMLRASEKTETESDPSTWDPELIRKMGDLMAEMAEKGVLLGGDGLRPSRFGKLATYKDGKRTVIDGPFTESKELVAGFSILKVDSWDEALYWYDRFCEVEGENVSEMRPLYDTEDFAGVMTQEEMDRENKLRNELQSRSSGG